MASEGSIRDRVLDAAVDVAAVHGLTKLSVGDVAKRAGVSRPTLYKHFPSKEALVAEAVLREATIIMTAVLAATDPIEDPTLALEAAIATTLRLARDHPVLERLVTTEPEALLPLLLNDDGPVATAVRAVTEDLVRRKVPDLPPEHLQRSADLIGRLIISYAVSTPHEAPDVVAAFAARALTQGVLLSAPIT